MKLQVLFPKFNNQGVLTTTQVAHPALLSSKIGGSPRGSVCLLETLGEKGVRPSGDRHTSSSSPGLGAGVGAGCLSFQAAEPSTGYRELAEDGCQASDTPAGALRLGAAEKGGW